MTDDLKPRLLDSFKETQQDIKDIVASGQEMSAARSGAGKGSSGAPDQPGMETDSEGKVVKIVQ